VREKLEEVRREEKIGKAFGDINQKIAERLRRL
jgi:hypothetical protein